jgi:hypothetical protein
VIQLRRLIACFPPRRGPSSIPYPAM